ncbi:MAG TPA: hypothetical protein VK982_09485 [Bacteroidales bacterium]|nr:hypothetical protein [Bacteroidales bacterium]
MKFVKDLSIIILGLYDIFFEILHQMAYSLIKKSDDYEVIEEIKFQKEIDNLLKSEVK